MPLPLWEEVLIGVALVPMLAATGIAALGLHEYSDDEDTDSDTPQAYRQYPPTMTNTLLAPTAEKPINYKGPAIFYTIMALLCFADSIRSQRREQLEIRAKLAEDDARWLDKVSMGLNPRPCVHVHCAEDGHIYAAAADVDEDSAA